MCSLVNITVMTADYRKYASQLTLHDNSITFSNSDSHGQCYLLKSSVCILPEANTAMTSFKSRNEELETVHGASGHFDPSHFLKGEGSGR